MARLEFLLRATAVTLGVVEPRVGGRLVRAVTGRPRVEEAVLGGVPTDVAVPPGAAPWPALVFCNGVTARGRRHPGVRGLALAFAQAGYLTAVPELHGLRRGELTQRTVADLVAVAGVLADDPRTRSGAVGLLGVSAGGSLALLGAARHELASRVSVVGALSPYADLREGARSATTGRHAGAGVEETWRPKPFLGLVIARSIAAGLEEGADRDRLLGALRAVDDDDPDPLAVLRDGGPDGLGPAASALVALLANRDPARFDALYDALPESLRRGLRELSPLPATSHVRAPVELATSGDDAYFPAAESAALAAAAPHARLTLTRAFAHVDLATAPGRLADLARLHACLARVLEHAAG